MIGDAPGEPSFSSASRVSVLERARAFETRSSGSAGEQRSPSKKNGSDKKKPVVVPSTFKSKEEVSGKDPRCIDNHTAAASESDTPLVKKLSSSSLSKHNTPPTFLASAVASWTRAAEKISNSADSESDDESDDDDEVTSNCTSVTASYTTASSATSTCNEDEDEDEDDDDDDGEDDEDSNEGTDEELSEYSDALIGIDSPPKVIRSSCKVFQAHNELLASAYGKKAPPSPAVTRSSSSSSNASVDSCAATVTRDDAKKDRVIATPAQSPRKTNKLSMPALPLSKGTKDEKGVVMAAPTTSPQPTKISSSSSSSSPSSPPKQSVEKKCGHSTKEPAWRSRLADTTRRQALLKKNEINQHAVHSSTKAPNVESEINNRQALPEVMHGQIVPGEEDWSKHFADDAFVAFDDNIFGRHEI